MLTARPAARFLAQPFFQGRRHRIKRGDMRQAKRAAALLQSLANAFVHNRVQHQSRIGLELFQHPVKMLV